MNFQKWYDGWEKNRKSERLGQAFINDFFVKPWPELYYERDVATAKRMIEEWLEQNSYTDSLPLRNGVPDEESQKEELIEWKLHIETKTGRRETFHATAYRKGMEEIFEQVTNPKCKQVCIVCDGRVVVIRKREVETLDLEVCYASQ